MLHFTGLEPGKPTEPASALILQSDTAVLWPLRLTQSLLLLENGPDFLKYFFKYLLLLNSVFLMRLLAAMFLVQSSSGSLVIFNGRHRFVNAAI